MTRPVQKSADAQCACKRVRVDAYRLLHSGLSSRPLVWPHPRSPSEAPLCTTVVTLQTANEPRRQFAYLTHWRRTRALHCSTRTAHPSGLTDRHCCIDYTAAFHIYRSVFLMVNPKSAPISGDASSGGSKRRFAGPWPWRASPGFLLRPFPDGPVHHPRVLGGFQRAPPQHRAVNAPTVPRGAVPPSRRRRARLVPLMTTFFPPFLRPISHAGFGGGPARRADLPMCGSPIIVTAGTPIYSPCLPHPSSLLLPPRRVGTPAFPPCYPHPSILLLPSPAHATPFPHADGTPIPIHVIPVVPLLARPRQSPRPCSADLPPPTRWSSTETGTWPTATCLSSLPHPSTCCRLTRRKWCRRPWKLSPLRPSPPSRPQPTRRWPSLWGRRPMPTYRSLLPRPTTRSRPTRRHRDDGRGNDFHRRHWCHVWCRPLTGSRTLIRRASKSRRWRPGVATTAAAAVGSRSFPSRLRPAWL